MTAIQPWLRGMARRLARAWDAFWFRSEPVYTLGLVRIAFGAMIIGWTLSLATDLFVRFGTSGFVPQKPPMAYTWTLFGVYPSDDALLVGWVVLLLAAIALTVGWRTRLAAVVVFIFIVSFERRNPYIFNAGDTLIRIESFLLMLAPAGAALSLDQRRRTGSFQTAQHRWQWPIRLLQIQVSIIYVSTVIAKLAGDTWQNGTAVLYSLRHDDLLFLPTPSWMTSNLLVSNVMTWATLVIELAIGLLVWNRRWRPWVLAAGVVLHLSIALTMNIGFFSLAMFVLYLAFVPNDRARALADRLSVRLRRRHPTADTPDGVSAERISSALEAVKQARRHGRHAMR